MEHPEAVVHPPCNLFYNVDPNGTGMIAGRINLHRPPDLTHIVFEGGTVCVTDALRFVPRRSCSQRFGLNGRLAMAGLFALLWLVLVPLG